MTNPASLPESLSAIARRAVIAGGGSAALGAKLGLRKSTVHSWTHSRIPLTWLPAVERETGIPRRELRPDVAALFETEAA
jgi:DNA-binding transcriptional regulator YdaS (Cro superfamily)